MRMLYNLSIYVYVGLIHLSSFFLKKSKRWLQGRSDLWIRLEREMSQNECPIWVHCASLGEFEQGRPVMEMIKKKHPRQKILVSFFSPSGYEVQKNYDGVDWVFYLPLDTKKNMARWLSIVRPKCLVLVKYEFWWNMISELKKKEIPIVLISGIFRKKHIFFQWYGSWFVRKLKLIDHFFLQNSESKALLNSIGIDQVQVVGDTRFDRVIKIAQRSEELPFVKEFKSNRLLVVAGSTWKKDERLLIEYINNDKTNTKYVIAPHEISETRMKELNNRIKASCIRYSKRNHQDLNSTKVFLLDEIGFLSRVYQYADISYIGGGFGKTGIHNCLEAAVFGTAVFFGPVFNSYLEAMDLIKTKGAMTIQDQKEFDYQLNLFISDANLRKTIGENAKKYVNTKKAKASIMIYEFLKRKSLLYSIQYENRRIES